MACSMSVSAGLNTGEITVVRSSGSSTERRPSPYASSTCRVVDFLVFVRVFNGCPDGVGQFVMHRTGRRSRLAREWGWQMIVHGLNLLWRQRAVWGQGR